MHRLGRWVGAGASLAAVPLWLAFLARVADSADGVSFPTALLAQLMLALAVGGVWFALAGWLFAMYTVFLVSFFPVGLYLLGSEALPRLIGVSNLVYLAAAVLLHLGTVRRRQG